MSKNKEYKNISLDNILDLVVEHGVSSYSNSKYISIYNAEWENSGYGLSIVNELCKLLKGTFIICSEKKGVIYDGYKETKDFFECDINGVGIQIRFYFGPNYDFEAVMKKVDEKLNLKKSSKTSRMLTFQSD